MSGRDLPFLSLRLLIPQAGERLLLGVVWVNDGQGARTFKPLVGIRITVIVASTAEDADFEGAAEMARKLKRYEFLFVAAPLRIEKGMGSPLNPVAIF